MCTDGFGALDIPIPGVVDVRNFQKGLYRCGKPIKSDTVAAPEIATPGSSPSSLITANTG